MGRLIFSLCLLFLVTTGFVVAEPQLAPSQRPAHNWRVNESNPPKNLTGGDKQEPPNQSQKEVRCRTTAQPANKAPTIVQRKPRPSRLTIGGPRKRGWTI